MQKFKQALSAINRVVAVGLGGSRGLALADENSDYDFVIFRHSGDRIDSKSIVDAVRPFADLGKIQDTVGFVRLEVSGKKIDIFQKELSLIEREIHMAKAGKFNWSIRQLFPHGDLSTCIISHITFLELCSEKDQCLTKLKKLAEPFPLLLTDSLTKTFATQASISLIHANKIQRPTDMQYYIGLCSAFVFFTNIVLFAINKKYPVIEKGGSRIITSLPNCPRDYDFRIAKIFRAAAEADFKLASAEMSGIEKEVKDLIDKVFNSRKTILPNEQPDIAATLNPQT
ncbi:MAG: hypothetical protein V4445_07490 [Pseudomonadota bacterium]